MAAGRAPVAHSRPVFGPDDERAVLRTLRSGQVAAGPEVERFEGDVARRLGLRGGSRQAPGPPPCISSCWPWAWAGGTAS